MNKKFLSLVLALVMVLGTFGNVFAAAAPAKKEEAKKEAPKLTTTEAKTQWLIDNKIVIGNADADGKANGDMGLDKPIRRDHVAKMLVFAMGEQDFAAKLQGVYRPFPDVELTSIVNGFISVAASKTSVNGVPIIAGYEDGTFRPTREVTYAELAKMLVVSIDKDLTPAKVKGMKWYSDWMKRAVELGILEGLSVDNPNAKAVRKDAFAMIYNAFFQLKDVKAVPANETRGIISEHRSDNKLVLNQGDFKKEFKVNEKTIYVNQAHESQLWTKSAVNFNYNYYVGSLVRVLADKDGVVTHIIEMGNPKAGIVHADKAWVDLGNKTFDKAHSAWNTAAKDVTLNVKDKFVEFNSNKFEITDKTDLYVADYNAGILTKVKDFDAAKAIVGEKTNKVYLAYEVLPTSGIKEAKVVVFNKADVEANTRLVRVAKAVSNPTYLLDVQGPGATATKVEQFDLSKVDNVWPYNYKLDADDVFELISNGNQYKGNKELVIDASEAPVYKIVKFLLVENGVEKEVERAQANAVVLEDKDKYQARFDLPANRDDFFTDKMIKGAHVQVAYRDSAKNILKVVSVVERDLKGILENGKDTTLVKGKVLSVSKDSGFAGAIRVNVQLEGQREGQFETYVCTKSWAELKALADAQANVVMKVKYVNKTYNSAEIVDIKLASVTPITPETQKFLDAMKALQTAAPEAKNIMLSDKGLLEAAIAANNKLSESVKNSNKALLNEYIKAFNALTADKSDDLAELV